MVLWSLSWGKLAKPPLRLQPHSQRVSPHVRDLFMDMWNMDVLEPADGKVLISYGFTVPKKDYPVPQLVVDASVLSKYICSFNCKMLTPRFQFCRTFRHEEDFR